MILRVNPRLGPPWAAVAAFSSIATARKRRISVSAADRPPTMRKPLRYVVLFASSDSCWETLAPRASTVTPEHTKNAARAARRYRVLNGKSRASRRHVYGRLG